MTYDIDIDELHAVIEGKSSGRRVGKTTAMMMQLLGTVMVGDPYATVLIVTHTPSYADQTILQFSKLLESENIKHSIMKSNEIHITQSGQRIIARTVDDIRFYHQRGIKLYNFFFDMPEHKMFEWKDTITNILDNNMMMGGFKNDY